MKTINDILEEQGFNEKEKRAFNDIIKEAKILQNNLMIEDLKAFIDSKISEVANED